MFIEPYRWQTVRILSVIRESLDAVTLVTERPEGYAFEPGQHAIVRVRFDDGTTRLRQYSFASQPDDHDLHFTITRSPGGEVSGWSIDRATTKSTIDISQAFTGPLQTDLSSYKHIGMIGGGSGIVPLMSYTRFLRSTDSRQYRTILYSTKGQQRCYENELQASSELERIEVRLTDEKSRFTASEIKAAMQDCDIILVCGSREFVTNIQLILHDSPSAIPVRAEAFSLQ